MIRPAGSPIPDRVASLLDFKGKPTDFWALLAGETVAALEAWSAAVYVRNAGSPDWQCVGVHPDDSPEARRSALRECAPALAKACGDAPEGRAEVQLPGDTPRSGFGVLQPLPGGKTRLALVAVAPRPDSPSARDAVFDTLRALAAAAPAFQAHHTLEQARIDVGHFSNVLDLLALLNAQDKFVGATMLLVNELSSRMRADRVSLGWLTKGYIRARAVSHMENFSKHMEGVQELEAAMEEAYEQDSEIVWPASDAGDAPLISRDHRKYADSQTAGHLVSVPIRDGDKPIAVLTLERKEAPFADNEVRWLRLCADQIARRLVQLEHDDVWFGRRWLRRGVKAASSLVGVEHTGWKLLGILGVLSLLFLLFGRWPHRVNGTFELRGDIVRVLPAPFDGFIDQAAVEKGDLVQPGDLLVRLDTRDMLIEKAAVLAELSRQNREAEKSRAEGDLAAMRMAEAMAEQASARLALVDDRLARAAILAPFAGAIVDGDLRDRSGAPVRQGDVLFRVAQWDALRVTAEIPESDIQFIRPGAEARLIFASRPEEPVRARIDRVEPMAQTRENKNVFVAHCVIEGAGEPWWRPGMTGTLRVSAGGAQPLWLLTRRTLDYFRLRWGW